eukprot:2019765-Prymnesium_polylepis.1
MMTIRRPGRPPSGAFPVAGRSFSPGCGTVPLPFSRPVALPPCAWHALRPRVWSPPAPFGYCGAGRPPPVSSLAVRSRCRARRGLAWGRLASVRRRGAVTRPMGRSACFGKPLCCLPCRLRHRCLGRPRAPCVALSY